MRIKYVSEYLYIVFDKIWRIFVEITDNMLRRKYQKAVVVKYTNEYI